MQFENMKNALKQIGIENEFAMETIEETINNQEVINNLVELYNVNEYEYELKDVSEQENMYEFLKLVDDVDCGGVVENFYITEVEM
ncbi:hypothetical protein ACLM5H_05070 [Fredinandcohnia humi]